VDDANQKITFDPSVAGVWSVHIYYRTIDPKTGVMDTVLFNTTSFHVSVKPSTTYEVSQSPDPCPETIFPMAFTTGTSSVYRF
jgi:hypothetical protein